MHISYLSRACKCLQGRFRKCGPSCVLSVLSGQGLCYAQSRKAKSVGAMQGGAACIAHCGWVGGGLGFCRWGRPSQRDLSRNLTPQREVTRAVHSQCRTVHSHAQRYAPSVVRTLRGQYTTGGQYTASAGQSTVMQWYAPSLVSSASRGCALTSHVHSRPCDARWRQTTRGVHSRTCARGAEGVWLMV